MLVYGLLRVSPIALESMTGGLEWWQALCYIPSVLMIGALEGYRGFQRGFSPCVVSQAGVLVARPTIMRALFAPFFCMALFGAERRRIIVSWSVLWGVTLLITAVGRLAQPWRGIVDAGVVVGLTWGIAATVLEWVRSKRSAQRAGGKRSRAGESISPVTRSSGRSIFLESARSSQAELHR